MSEVLFLCDTCQEALENGGVFVEGGKIPPFEFVSLNEALGHILSTGHRVELDYRDT